MSLVGTKAPEFELEGNEKGQMKKFSLSALKGKWAILIFYPRSFTGVCGSEVKGFAQEEGRFEALGARIMAISTDSPFVHKAWLESEVKNVGYPVLADVTHEVSRQYGVLADNGAALRATFIIDPEGTVVHESVNFFPVGRSTEEVYRILSAFQSGHACDLNWKPPQ